MKDLAKKALPDLLVIVGFLVIAFLYFFTPLSQDLVLGGHDTVAGMGQGHEQQLFREATGETTRWTGSIFSGMPTYQIAPTYGPTSLLGKIGWIIGLFTTGPLNYIFIYLFGFYILMRSFNLRPAISALGSILWAFSSYFFIIIAAGHIWKVNTLGFIPPTIAGLIIAYNAHRTDRPRLLQGTSGYLLGALVTALFTGLQVLSNHLQMTYYFLFVMAAIVIAYGVEALIHQRKGAAGVNHWLKATAAIIVGGLLGAAINLPNLYHTYQYSHESMRGPAELTAAAPDQTDATGVVAQEGAPAAQESATGGLDRDYITQWSYGIDETMTLLIPMYKGGGSTAIMDLDGVEDLDGYDDWRQYAGATQEATQGQLGASLPGLLQYWGDQPMTVGPVYVGAIVCFLFLLGIFVVRGPMKWALLVATLISLLFAWGRNIMPITDFFIDHLPMYNKFRTVSSALVIAEFTMPLLGILGLAEVLRRPDALLGTRRGKIGLAVSLTFSAGLALIYALAPDMANNISTADSQMLLQLQNMGILPPDAAMAYRSAILTLHGAILSASAWRSFWLVVVAAAAIIAYVKWPKSFPAWGVVALLAVVSIADMWNVNLNYLNDDNFEAESTRLDGFSQTPADKVILADKDPDYRVLNLSAGNPFNESDNHTAYWHKSIGGYHAAKLHRYQDLIDRHLNDEVQRIATTLADTTSNIITRASDGFTYEIVLDSVAPVINMLNARWLIAGQGGAVALRNTSAQGNAWFVTDLSYVADANAEMAALKTLDLRRQAVADARFQPALGDAVKEAAPGDKVALTSYAPNELHYTVESQKGGVVAFSEIYYPGWSATIDGESAEIGRVNYVLRALRVPAGKHEVVLEFRPASLTATDAIAYTALALLLAGFALLIFCAVAQGTERAQ